MRKMIFTKAAILSILVLVVTLSSCLHPDKNETVYSAAIEKALRQNYLNNLESLGHDIDTTELGVYYIVLEEGEGDFAQTGDTLTVGYSGWFIDEVLFDSSDIKYPDGKMTFALGDSASIAGWTDAMKVMNKGAKIQFIIPSGLAYGSSWYGNIPPYQTLIFVVKLFDIKPS